MTTQNETTTTLNTFEQNEVILDQLVEEIVATSRHRKVKKTERSVDDEVSSCNE
jgi:hypothetical protein